MDQRFGIPHAYLKEHQSAFPGVEVVEASVRDYPQGTMAAHILGWVGQISADELKSRAFKGYGPNDLVGKAGLELQYEKYLRGKKGYEKFLLNAQQQEIRAIGTQAATPGNNLVLSIDLRAQRIAETALSQGIANARKIFDTSQSPPAYLKANSGAVIVMDPSTGAIKALASWPTYDPSWFVQGLSNQQAAYLFTNPAAPTLNRATQLTFAPGSTFKPFVALSALYSGIASLGGYYDCPATYVFPGDTSGTVFHNWSATSLGSLSLAQALKVSCDTVFYQFGADFYNRYTSNQLGVHALDLQKNLAQFGFGSPTGIDLPSEAQGLIPTPDWKKRFARQNPQLFNPGEQVWLPGDDIQMAIGQGYVTVTPMELATAFAAIANGGKMCRPHLVDRIVDPSGHVVKRIGGRCTRSLPFTRAEIDYIRSALATVTQPGGTAGLAFAGFPLSQLPVAGKTGTAQRPPFQDTSWFAGMAPAGSPRYLVLAMVEQGGHGSTSAAPIVRQVIEGLFGINGNGPSNGGVSD
jgi:penicillin-binding protein 2